MNYSRTLYPDPVFNTIRHEIVQPQETKQDYNDSVKFEKLISLMLRDSELLANHFRKLEDSALRDEWPMTRRKPLPCYQRNPSCDYLHYILSYELLGLSHLT